MSSSTMAKDCVVACCSCLMHPSGTERAGFWVRCWPPWFNSQVTFCRVVDSGVKQQVSLSSPKRCCLTADLLVCPQLHLPSTSMKSASCKSSVFGVWGHACVVLPILSRITSCAEPRLFFALARSRFVPCRPIMNMLTVLWKPSCLVIFTSPRWIQNILLTVVAKLRLCSFARSQAHSKQLNFQK